MAQVGGPAASAREKRNDIQGLRAVGALLVAVFHIWVGRVSGGVDVFFIVSGYLLLGSLGRRADADGAIDLKAFVARLAQRLLPQSYAVIFFILVLGVLVLPQGNWVFIIKNVAASAVYVENWFLAASSVDYLARDEIPSPLQHYWAMSVQVQCLLLWGILLWGYLKLAAVRGGRAGAIPFIALLTALSLAYSIYATDRDQASAYYDSFARLWEFGLGGLVALTAHRWTLGQGARALLSWLGLALIVSCGFVLNAGAIFPGYAALWPTLGAALILVCGRSGERYNVGAFLGLAPMVWLGGISYGLYLWHWPLLILYRSLAYDNVIGIVPGFAILGGAVVLAWLTTRLIDEKVERFRHMRLARTAFASMAALSVLTVMDGAWAAYTKQLMPQHRLRKDEAVHYPGAAALYAAARVDKRDDYRPGPLWVKKDVADVYDDGCHQTLAASAAISCSYGPKDAGHVVVLIGGSHSAQWLPAFQEMLKGRDWRIVTMTKSSCLFSATGRSGEKSPNGSCALWNRNAMGELRRLKPDLVVTTATHGKALADEDVYADFIAQWRAVVGLGARVIAVRDNPWHGFDVGECVEINGPFDDRCSLRRKDVLSAASPLARAIVPKGVNLLDFSDLFCGSEQCPAVIGNVLVYRDKHHITGTYMRTMAPAVWERMGPIFMGAGGGVTKNIDD